MAGDRCAVIGCRSYADTDIVIERSVQWLRERYFPPEATKKRLRVCNNHQKSIMLTWARNEVGLKS